MAKSRIAQISFVRTFDGDFGKTFVYSAILEDGCWGDINCKSENKYKVGDEISYEMKSREYQGKTLWTIKVLPEVKTGFGGFKSEDPNKTRSIAKQTAVKEAVNLCVGGKISLEQLFVMSDKIFEYINK